jgi:hypothetical protein
VVIISESNLLGDPLGGGRHQLHQTGSADIRFGTGDEAAFLAHQAINPSIVERLIPRRRAHLIAVGGKEA